MNTKIEKIERVDALSWFEIHAADFKRAKRFYETVLQTSMEEVKVGDTLEALFPFDRDETGVGGSIVETGATARGQGGTMVYLNVEGDLDDVLSRIPDAGGKIVKPRTAIGPYGFIAVFADTEGNVVGLHSRN
jgi:predicted enzyme related to lactoylglutathione lyase